MGLWAKFTALLSVVIGALLIALKLKSAKIENLEGYKKVREEIDEIDAKQVEDKQEVLADEDIRVTDRVEDSSKFSRSERIKRMRDNKNSAL